MVTHTPDNSWIDKTRTLAGPRPTVVPVFELRCLTTGKSWEFASTPVSFGSHPQCDVHLEDDTVSRLHAEIVRMGSELVLRDKGSTNGTAINGVRIREGLLSPGVTIELGEQRLAWTPDLELIPSMPSENSRFELLVGQSDAMRRLFNILERVSATDAPILIQGETGTGKDVVARSVHAHSKRSNRPFVVVDCSAIPPALMESELFGHEKGAFSGAIAVRKGLFEQGNGGTIFLDEVGELPLELQPKLLRVLETGVVRRIGSGTETSLDLRILSATNRPLQEMVDSGRFRADLFYRLNVVPVFIPPLRERTEDIQELVHHILHTAPFNRKGDGTLCVTEVTSDFLGALRGHAMPGNVRELVNILQREVALTSEPILHSLVSPLSEQPASEDSTPTVSGDLPPFSEAKEDVVDEFEMHYLERLMIESRQNLSLAARIAGLDRKHLRNLLKKHQIYHTTQAK